MKHWVRVTLDWISLPYELIYFSKVNLDLIRVDKFKRFEEKLGWRCKYGTLKIIKALVKYRFKKNKRDWK